MIFTFETEIRCSLERNFSSKTPKSGKVHMTSISIGYFEIMISSFVSGINIVFSSTGNLEGDHFITLISDFLDKYPKKKYTISNLLWESHQARKVKNMKAGKGFGFKLSYPTDTHTRTISSRYFKDGGECLISRGKDKNPRLLTPREVFRLQGFPENFKIPVSNNQAYKQAGNAVPVKVVEKICFNIINVLIVNKDKSNKVA